MKVSEMQEANSVNNADYLMIVQDGASKKVSCEKFIKEGDSVESAQSLNGYTDEDFLKANDTAKNSEKLGGINASEYVRKTDSGLEFDDPTWCTPKMWFTNIETDEDPNTMEFSSALVANNYVVCDGRFLDVTEYNDLFKIIGYKYGKNEQTNAFAIPDMRGRFPLGANVAGNGSSIWGEKKTFNLPQNLYSGEDFDANGQWKFPDDAGKKGGDPTTTQDSKSQIAQHSHSYQDYEQDGGTKKWINNGSGTVTEEDTAIPRLKSPKSTLNTNNGNGLVNVNNYAEFPHESQGNFNYGMLSMPPYLSFCFIMKVKK